MSLPEDETFEEIYENYIPDIDSYFEDKRELKLLYSEPED